MTPEALSELTLDFYRLAESSNPLQFRQQALERIQAELDFDLAAWDLYATLDGAVHLQDRFVHETIAGTKLNADAGMPPAVLLPVSDVGVIGARRGDATSSPEFGNRDQPITGALTTTHELERAGLIHVLCLQRRAASRPFTEDERAFAGQFLPHLVEALGQCRRFEVRRALMRAWEARFATAVANARGVLYDAQDQFLAAIAREWPDWRGARLPDELLSHLASDLEWHFAGRHVTLNGRTLGNLRVLVASRPGPLALLTERELDVARRFAHGESHKEIGERLFIAPATVRNHLSSAYAKLQISNKSELHALMSVAVPHADGELPSRADTESARAGDRAGETSRKEEE